MRWLSIHTADGSPPVLHVRGELDLATAEEFGAALHEATSADPTLVVDLSDVTFIDAAGLRVILRAAESRDGVGPLKLVNASRVVWLLRLVGLEGIPAIEIAPEGFGHDG